MKDVVRNLVNDGRLVVGGGGVYSRVDRILTWFMRHVLPKGLKTCEKNCIGCFAQKP